MIVTVAVAVDFTHTPAVGVTAPIVGIVVSILIVYVLDVALFPTSSTAVNLILVIPAAIPLVVAMFDVNDATLLVVHVVPSVLTAYVGVVTIPDSVSYLYYSVINKLLS